MAAVLMDAHCPAVRLRLGLLPWEAVKQRGVGGSSVHSSLHLSAPLAAPLNRGAAWTGGTAGLARGSPTGCITMMYACAFIFIQLKYVLSLSGSLNKYK